jgi:Tfp pilus assembly protein PilW
MMVSIAILLVVGAVAFAFLSSYQNYYQSTALKADMHSGLRAATTLLEQEIGQAGLVSLTSTCSTAFPATSATCPTLCPSGSSCASAGISSSGSAQTVPVSSTAGMFVGEYLLVDTGAAQETVHVTALGTSPASITAVFANNHPQSAPPGAVVAATGMFPQGILSPGLTGGSSYSQTTQISTLNMIGDLIGDGNLYYVQYACNPPSGGSPGTLTRSVTNLLTATSQGTAVPLLDDLAANPNSAPCFQYSTTAVVVQGTTYTFTTGVSVTLTVQTAEIDPITQQATKETKSFLNLVPRNILGGYNLANAGFSIYFQPNPSALCTTSGVTC